jgi:hypothetical protein
MTDTLNDKRVLERQQNNLKALENLPTLLANPIGEGQPESYMWIDSYCIGCQQRHLPAKRFVHDIEGGRVCGPISLVHKEFALSEVEAKEAWLTKEALIDLRREAAKELVNKEMHRMDINADYFASVREKFKIQLEVVAAENKEIPRVC